MQSAIDNERRRSMLRRSHSAFVEGAQIVAVGMSAGRDGER
jgi:hypothetical protein